MTNRRQFLAGTAAILALPSPAFAADYAIDWQGGTVDPAVAARLARQIAIVKALPIRPDILAFFARQPIRVLTGPGEGSHVNTDPVVYFTRDAFPDDNPVLLHEMIHRWHFGTLADTPRVQPLRKLFDAERAHPHWPRRAYMYENISEFLAMTASVVLYGRAARPPYTRAQVANRTPDLYRWIVDTFGLRLS